MRLVIYLAIFFALPSVSIAQTTNPAKPPSAAASTAPSIESVVGDYRFDSGLIMSLEKMDQTAYVKSTGQPQQALTISPDGHFNYPSIAAYLTFDVDKAGKATKLHFHFDEKSLTAKRIDAAVAKKANDALDLKIKNKTHDPACAATLKRLIEEGRMGKPDYSKMTLTLAQATRTQLPMMQQRFQELGAVKEVKFLGVGPMGAEQFDLQFEKGALQSQIFCLPNGFISGAGFR
jgi:hypothetical protein